MSVSFECTLQKMSTARRRMSSIHTQQTGGKSREFPGSLQHPGNLLNQFHRFYTIPTRLQSRRAAFVQQTSSKCHKNETNVAHVWFLDQIDKVWGTSFSLVGEAFNQSAFVHATAKLLSSMGFLNVRLFVCSSLHKKFELLWGYLYFE